MIRSLWVARTGLDAQQTSLDVISNNLANVSTNGVNRCANRRAASPSPLENAISSTASGSTPSVRANGVISGSSVE